jgi:hypothetical protein
MPIGSDDWEFDMRRPWPAMIEIDRATKAKVERAGEGLGLSCRSRFPPLLQKLAHEYVPAPYQAVE